MKMLALLAIGALSFAGAANAQTTVIEHSGPPGVVVEHDAPVVEHRTTVETKGRDCSSTTVHKETDNGSKTVKKTDC